MGCVVDVGCGCGMWNADVDVERECVMWVWEMQYRQRHFTYNDVGVLCKTYVIDITIYGVGGICILQVNLYGFN